MAPIDLPPFATPAKSGIRIALRVTPGAARNRLEFDGSELRARVTAAPEKGKANIAVIKLVAKAWALPKTSFSVMTGSASRNKALLIDRDAGFVAGKLAAWISAQKQGKK